MNLASFNILIYSAMRFNHMYFIPVVSDLLLKSNHLKLDSFLSAFSFRIKTNNLILNKVVVM